MAKTLVQQLTTATLRLNQNPQDVAAAKAMQETATAIAPLWTKAKKPAEMSAGRIASTGAWLVVAAVDAALAAADGPTAAGALLALTVTVDGVIEEKGWMKYALDDDLIPSLGEVAEAIGDLVKKGAAAVVAPAALVVGVTFGGVALIGLAAWALTRARA